MTGAHAPEDLFGTADLDLHPDEVRRLFASGFYEEAVRLAAQGFIVEIKQRAGDPDLDGARLVAQVFADKSPMLAFSERKSRLERNEHEGYRFLAMGLVQAIRNQVTHNTDRQYTRIQAFEWLAFISGMRRMLDYADPPDDASAIERGGAG